MFSNVNVVSSLLNEILNVGTKINDVGIDVFRRSILHSHPSLHKSQTR